MKRIVQILGFIGIALIIMFFGENDTNEKGDKDVNSDTTMSILRKEKRRCDYPNKLHRCSRHFLSEMWQEIPYKRKYSPH